MLAEIQCWRSGGDAHAIGCVRGKCLPVSKAKCAVEVGKKSIRRALICIVHARLKVCLPLTQLKLSCPCQVLTMRPSGNAPFRPNGNRLVSVKVARETAWPRYVRRHGANGVGGEGDVQTVVSHADFIGDVRAEVVRITQQDGLAKAGTLTGNPAAASPKSRLKLLPRLNR